ncbi:lipase member K-like [Haemaphysalis longicornis]
MRLTLWQCVVFGEFLLSAVLGAQGLPVDSRNSFYAGADLESCSDIESLITSKGYLFERHSVVTDDGYVIEMHRITYGREPCSEPCRTQPILLMSPLLTDSTVYVLDSPEQSLGFLLADRKYDVWMGNVRGNTYGKRHESIDARWKSFWNYSFHEHAVLDLPAQIDYVLEVTSRNDVPYLGVSQGTLILFTLLSERPEYNAKVRVFAALAPFNKLVYMDMPHLSAISPYAEKYLSGPYEMFLQEVLPLDMAVSPLARGFCALKKSACSRFAETYADLGAKYANKTRLPAYLCHVPAGTSSKNLFHYAQLVTSKRAQAFDYGPHKNMLIYNQEEPHLYDISNFQTDVGIFWSQGDHFVPPENVRILLKDLGENVKLNHFIDDPHYTHMHFVVATNNGQVLFPALLPFLDRYATRYLD